MAHKTSGAFKKIPGMTKAKQTLLLNKFTRMAKKGVHPDKARKANMFKNNDEFAMYQVVYNTVRRKKPSA
ncbi:hypothetical protein GN244_ATG01388 [Phytophthora infestans]|uniref:Uncharacterized protein n=1 Tax=Phytophthora infestans TaxID=4787 RepID=A0A833WN30_PHYIN|nr:hypothetical protein GN244_ATG01388 [Phytophthora infestans]KAF4131626.1 hypothetical protein GN958_ATG19184 [Phytophthora infestans]